MSLVSPLLLQLSIYLNNNKAVQSSFQTVARLFNVSFSLDLIVFDYCNISLTVTSS
ncbi:hypothetical protein ABIA69_000727 [Lysinibacillus parviboronicapiens]|uniref:Uncharacterized protein n=1 Tax=Lysinibacillus parviboronicapiens TaxID=436516 RepID=A0ABV2PFK8_9BACI